MSRRRERGKSSTAQEVTARQSARYANGARSGETGTKIVVRNIPFEATQDEVDKLFR